MCSALLLLSVGKCSTRFIFDCSVCVRPISLASVSHIHSHTQQHTHTHTRVHSVPYSLAERLTSCLSIKSGTQTFHQETTIARSLSHLNRTFKHIHLQYRIHTRCFCAIFFHSRFNFFFALFCRHTIVAMIEPY